MRNEPIPLPTPAEVERAMARGRRLRAEAFRRQGLALWSGLGALARAVVRPRGTGRSPRAPLYRSGRA